MGDYSYRGDIRDPTPGSALYPRLSTEADPGVDLGGAMLRVVLMVWVERCSFRGLYPSLVTVQDSG